MWEWIYLPQSASLFSCRKEIILLSKLQKKFSKQADHTISDHVPCHRTDKLLCCVCGQAYQDLARFIYHCQSHDEREYHKVCASEQAEPHIAVGPPALLAIPRNEFSDDDNGHANDEVNILIENNPIYSRNQIAYHNQMLDHNLCQHYLNMRLFQARNRPNN